MQQDKHNVSQSMHGVQTCGEYDMSIEHNKCEHNQQIWRCWCTNARCRGMSGGSKVHPISVSAPDEDINTIVTPTAPAAIHTGPITRARARQLNYQVLSFLGNGSNVHENMMLPKLDTLVFLTNEGPSLDKKDEPWSKFKHGDDGMRKGITNRVTSDDFRTLKPP